MDFVWAHNGIILIRYEQINKSKKGSFLAHNGFILILLSNYWLLNMGLYWFDSKLIFAHFRLYCGEIITIIEFYNSIMGFDNFEHGQNNLIMGGILFFREWACKLYIMDLCFPMMACLIGKLLQLWAQYFEL